MGIRYREVAVRHALSLLKEHTLTREDIGELYNNGRRLTPKQLARVDKHYQKIVSRFQAQVDRIDARLEQKSVDKKEDKKKKKKVAKKK